MSTLRLRLQRLRRSAARWVCLVLVSGMAGCVTRPPRPPLVSTVRGKELGRIGVGFTTDDPDLVIVRTPPSKSDASLTAARKAARVLFEISAGGAESALLATLLAPVVIGGGAVYGAVAGVSRKEVADAISSMEKGRDELRIYDSLRAALRDKLIRDASMALDLAFDDALSGPTMAKPGSAQAEAQMAAAIEAVGCDTLLRIHVLQFGLFGSSGLNPRLSLYVRIEARLFRCGDWAEAGIFYSEYESERRRFTTWSADNARILRAEYDQAMAALATRLIAWLAGGPAPPPISASGR